MFGGETEGDGDDGLFVKQDAEPEVLSTEELHNTDLEVPPLTAGETDVEKELASSGGLGGRGMRVCLKNLSIANLLLRLARHQH
jgi:hypothetical protein